MSIFGHTGTLATVTLAASLTAAGLSGQPLIFYSDLESGPKSGGENNAGVYVTIYGQDFGPSRGGSSVTIGGGPASGYARWSDNRITFQPGAAVATGNIVVTTSVGTSNPVPFVVRAGNIYFVAVSGADGNDGSFARPWRTVLHARDTMQPGDTVYLMDGVSQASDDGQGWRASMLLSTGGTPSAPMAFLGYPGATATIGGVNAPNSGIRSNEKSSGNWVISNLTLRGQNEAIALWGSDNWKFTGNDISCPNGDGPSGCVITSLTNHVKFYGNNVHNTGGPNASSGYHGVYFSTDSNHLEIAWNTIAYARGCRGLQFHSSQVSVGDTTGNDLFDISIHDNVIHDTQCDGIVLATVDPSKGPISIFNNLIYNAGQGPNNPEGSGDWACIQMQGYTNNGRPPGPGTPLVEIFNNTLYNCGSFANPPYLHSRAAVQNAGANLNIKVHLKDNILYQPPGNTAPYVLIYGTPNRSVCAESDNCNGIFGENNLFFGNGPAPASTTFTGSLNKDPMFVDVGAYDFHLRPASPAVGLGALPGQLAVQPPPPASGPNPEISAVVNAASLIDGFAPSSWVIIQGRNLSPTTRMWRSDEIVNGRLPVSLDGVSVKINGLPAFVSSISSSQIRAQVPSDDLGASIEKLAPVQLTTPNGTATAQALERSIAPAMFMLDDKYLAAMNPDGSVAAPEGLSPDFASRPAQTGKFVSLYATGMGSSIDPSVPAGQMVLSPSALLDPVNVVVGGVEAQVSFAGLVGPGLYQINFIVPDVADGDQPIKLRVSGVDSQNSGLIRIRK